MSHFAFLRSVSRKAPVLTTITPPGLSVPMFTISAAGFIATSTSGASPGVWMSSELNCSWKPETPGRVPAGARISAGKSGSVARSLPKSALVRVNWLPVTCMPSPESPAKRITTRSSCWRGSSPGWGSWAEVVVIGGSRVLASFFAPEPDLAAGRERDG